MKKRSPSTSCSSSSSSSTSAFVLLDHHQSIKPTIKRPRKNQTKKKCQTAAPNFSGRRSSVYRGVTRHRWTGRFEAHLWDKNSWNNVQNKKGRQVYLGAYDCEEAAAKTYDLAALKYWGPETTLNFPIETYKTELEEMQKVSKEEYLASLRRRSSGFSRGVSKYRGVARHHHNGRWEARIGRVFGNKYLYLGTYNTQEEAAAAYDMAAIEYRGANAVTNFDISHYLDRLKVKGIFPHQSSTDQSEDTEPELEVEQQQQHQQQPAEEQQEEHVDGNVNVNADAIVSPEVGLLDQHHYHEYIDTTEDIHEMTWSFNLDNPGFTPLLVPDFSFGNVSSDHLPDIFADTGFDNDIDFIFNEMDDIVEGNLVEDNSVKTADQVRLLSSSLSSSSLSRSSPSFYSTAASVSSNCC